MTKLEQAARQALDALEVSTDWDVGAKGKQLQSMKAITALREALEQLNCQCGDKCFPVFSGDIEYCETCGKPTALAEQVHTLYCKQAPMCNTPCGNSDCAEQAEQEPVAYQEKMSGVLRYGKINDSDTPLYAAPVRTKDLTDDEIAKAYLECEGYVIACCRAVIAADREKNCG